MLPSPGTLFGPATEPDGAIANSSLTVAINRAPSALLPLNEGGPSRSEVEDGWGLGAECHRCRIGVCSSGAGFGVTEVRGRRTYEDDWTSLVVSHLPSAFVDGRWCAGERRRIGRTIASRSRRKPCARDGLRVRDERVSLDGLRVRSVGVCNCGGWYVSGTPRSTRLRMRQGQRQSGENSGAR